MPFSFPDFIKALFRNVYYVHQSQKQGVSCLFSDTRVSNNVLCLWDWVIVVSIRCFLAKVVQSSTPPHTQSWKNITTLAYETDENTSLGLKQ